VKRSFVLPIFLMAALLLAGCDGTNVSPPPTPVGGEASFSNLGDLEKVSDVTSGIYRFLDEDYGVVVYIADTYGLTSAPSVAVVRVGPATVEPRNGVTKIVDNPNIYRIVDTELGTIVYVVDTYRLATAPTIAVVSLK